MSASTRRGAPRAEPGPAVGLRARVDVAALGVGDHEQPRLAGLGQEAGEGPVTLGPEPLEVRHLELHDPYAAPRCPQERATEGKRALGVVRQRPPAQQLRRGVDAHAGDGPRAVRRAQRVVEARPCRHRPIPRAPRRRTSPYPRSCPGATGRSSCSTPTLARACRMGPHEAAHRRVNEVVARLRPAPEFVVFPGDEVIGLTPDEAALRGAVAALARRRDGVARPGGHAALQRHRQPHDLRRHERAVVPGGRWRICRAMARRARRGLSYAVRRGGLLMVVVHTLPAERGGRGPRRGGLAAPHAGGPRRRALAPRRGASPPCSPSMATPVPTSARSARTTLGPSGARS